MRNVFVVHTPFQLFVAEQIVRTNEAFNGAENIVVLEIKQNITCSVELWSEIHHLQYIGGSMLGRTNRQKSNNNIELLYGLLDGSKHTRILISDIAWPQNNRIFFDKKISLQASFSLIIDGVVSYTACNINLLAYFQGWLKRIVGAVGFGVRYRPYIGRLTGEDRSEIDNVFGFSAYALSCPGRKKVDIPVSDTSNHIRVNNRSLFLGQPYWKFMRDSEWVRIRDATLNFMMSIESEERFYKPHYHDREIDSLFYKENGILLLKDCRCIEQVFTDNFFSTVVSYNSSALFNLKCIYGDSIRCISLSAYRLGIKTTADKSSVSRMLKLFDSVGVELVDLQ